MNLFLGMREDDQGVARFPPPDHRRIPPGSGSRHSYRVRSGSHELGTPCLSKRGRGPPCSGPAVSLGFQNPELFDQHTEFRRVCADDASDAHGVVVGFEAGKLVLIRNESKAAVQAMIVVGVACIEENLLVSDDVLKEGPVGERGVAGAVPGETGEVEPVPGEPLRPGRQPSAVAFDMDEGRAID